MCTAPCCVATEESSQLSSDRTRPAGGKCSSSSRIYLGATGRFAGASSHPTAPPSPVALCCPSASLSRRTHLHHFLARRRFAFLLSLDPRLPIDSLLRCFFARLLCRICFLSCARLWVRLCLFVVAPCSLLDGGRRVRGCVSTFLGHLRSRQTLLHESLLTPDDTCGIRISALVCSWLYGSYMIDFGPESRFP